MHQRAQVAGQFQQRERHHAIDLHGILLLQGAAAGGHSEDSESMSGGSAPAHEAPAGPASGDAAPNLAALGPITPERPAPERPAPVPDQALLGASPGPKPQAAGQGSPGAVRRLRAALAPWGAMFPGARGAAKADDSSTPGPSAAPAQAQLSPAGASPRGAASAAPHCGSGVADEAGGPGAAIGSGAGRRGTSEAAEAAFGEKPVILDPAHTPNLREVCHA